MSKLMAAIGILLGVLFFGGYLSCLQIVRIVFYLFGLGVPSYILFEPIFVWIGVRKKLRLRKYQDDLLIKSILERYRNSASAPAVSQSRKETGNIILEPSQITRLNALRGQFSIADASRFPKIRITGKDMTNLAPDAGCFTAVINREGEITNVVILLATLHAVSEFERICSAYSGREKDFWAEGYLLPSRTGLCFSVLLTTAFRLNDRYLQF
jgi:hypothetical protein